VADLSRLINEPVYLNLMIWLESIAYSDSETMCCCQC